MIKEIMQSFKGYIKDSQDIDIVYSEKLGYLVIHMEDLSANEIESPEDVLYYIFSEMALDLRLKNPESSISYVLSDSEKSELRKLVGLYVSGLTEIKEFVESYLEDFMNSYGK
jgi:hypothetical protein